MKKLTIFFVFCLILSSVVCADDPSFYFKKGENITLKIPCINDGAPCSNNSNCNISINYPNGSNMVLNQMMDSDGIHHTYNLPNSNTKGLYNAVMFCRDDTKKGYSTPIFEINQEGFKPNSLFPIGGIFVSILMSIIYIYSSFKMDNSSLSIKLPLLFIGFVNIMAGILIAVLMQNNPYSIPTILNAMLWVNIILVAYMVYKYIKKWITIKKEIKEKN